MDLEIFMERLKQLREMAMAVADEVEKDPTGGMAKIQELSTLIEVILPEWFYFIDQTGIGEKAMILGIMKDMAEASENKDQILLLDTLIYGLGNLAEEYRSVIGEALDGEE